VCDLDGTLLRSDGTLSAFARDGLNRLIAAGLPTTIASGRSLQAMRALGAGVALELPVIGLNGALISDPATGRHLEVRALERSTARTTVDELSAVGASPTLTTWDGTQDRVRYIEEMNDASTWWIAEKRAYADPRLQLSEHLSDVTAEEETVLITGFVPNEDASAVAARLHERLADDAIVHAGQHIYCTGWTELQVQHRQADKGRALSRFLALTGLQSAELVVCGDHLNDLGMFAIADQSVAPANAHEAVRLAATVVVATNDEDGVIQWLTEQYLT